MTAVDIHTPDMQHTPLRSALTTPPTLARVQEKRMWDEDEFGEDEEEEEEEQFEDHEAVFFSVTIAKGTTADKLMCAPTASSLQAVHTRPHRLRVGGLTNCGAHGGRSVVVWPF